MATLGLALETVWLISLRKSVWAEQSSVPNFGSIWLPEQGYNVDVEECCDDDGYRRAHDIRQCQVSASPSSHHWRFLGGDSKNHSVLRTAKRFLISWRL